MIMVIDKRRETKILEDLSNTDCFYNQLRAGDKGSEMEM